MLAFGGERGEEEAATGAEVVGGEGVEGREGGQGVDRCQYAVVAGVHGETEDGDIFRQEGVGDQSFDNACVGDSGDGAVAKGSYQEALPCWVPR